MTLHKDFELINYQFIPSADLRMEFEEESKNIRGGAICLQRIEFLNYLLSTLQNDYGWKPNDDKFQQLLETILHY